MHGLRLVSFVVALTVITGGGFWFFHAVPSVCTSVRDPSGGMNSSLCTLSEPSPYQTVVMAWHARVLGEVCAISAETGDIECRPALPSFGCDQSATTTDCTKIMQENPSPPIPPQDIEATTTTIGIISFDHPSNWRVTAFGWEKVAVPGAYNISIPDAGPDGERHVFLFTAPSPFSSINPAAESLDDYRTGYPLSPTTTQEVLVKDEPTTIETREQVRILFTEDVVVNGIPMLRQRYSIGRWQPDFNGTIVFWSTDELGEQNQLRYVFFDDTTFVVITGWRADTYIDQIARSVRMTR